MKWLALQNAKLVSINKRSYFCFPLYIITFVYTQHVSHTSTGKHVYTTGYRFTIALTQNVKLRNHFLS